MQVSACWGWWGDLGFSKLIALLTMQGLNAKTITQTVELCGAGRYAKTDSRKTLGCMNDLVRCYTTMVEAQGGSATSDLTAIIQKINGKPQRTSGWGCAWDVTEALLAGMRSKRH
jgi:hypothetical protein